MSQIINNYEQDLIKSREEPLLIEINKKDIDNFGDNGLEKVKLFAKAIYDDPIKKTNETNIIYLKGNDATDIKHTYLLDQFLNLTADQLKESASLKIVKESINSALSIGAGGILDNTFGGFIDEGVGLIVDNVNNSISDFIVDTVVENVDFSSEILGRIENKVFETINDTTTSFLDELNENTLYLSDASKKTISELASHLKKKLTPAESFRFILKLMLSVTIDMPTLLIIENPHKLDNDSLAILSLLFSMSKDIKDKYESEDKNEKEKPAFLSVMYIHSSNEFQPYEPLKLDNLNKEQQKYIKESKTLIDQQRLFTQRYAMLERPTSDIPRFAVKSNMFVGREEELENLHNRYNYSKENQDIATLEIISGEPGIGKTKLFKKHIHNLRLSEENGSKLIQLTLLNQVGHSSSNTGLSSLTESIINEANRLETVKTFKEKAIDKAKDTIKDGITGFIKRTLGIDKLYDVAIAANDRLDLDENILKTKQNTIGDLNNKTENEKEKQFNNLDTAIDKLLTVSDKSMPIVLFIDDLQWIDDTSSEYILTHFIQNFNVHIVSTLRPSDGATILSKDLENKSLNEFRIALLNQTDIKVYDKDKNEIKIESNIDTSKIAVSSRYLKGLNSQTLKELISQVIEGDKDYQQILADTIIEKLTNGTNDKEVNTLFAVETINMLCDKKLYSTQDKDTKIEQLILTDLPIRFNDELKNFKSSLIDTFEVLEKKYKSSLSHYNATTNLNEQRFNTMAYAILEERLNILKVYFKEHGNAAVNTLLFSSLLGTPFNSKIIKNILEELSSTKEKLLRPLKNYILKDKNETSLTQEHYEIIEEVYEILSRYISFDDSYEYRHSLLNVFLDKQLEYQLDETLGKDNIEVKDNLYELILEEIEKELKKQDFYNKHEESLNIKQYQKMLFFRITEQKVLKKGFDNNQLKWVERYILSLHKLSTLYMNFNQPKDSIELGKKSFDLTKKLFEENILDARYYVKSLNNLGDKYDSINNLKKAIEYFKEAKKISEFFYKEKPELWKEDYIVSLSNLATLYYKTDKILAAINIVEEILDYTKSQKEDSISFTKQYLVSLNNLAIFYGKVSRSNDAIKLLETALEIVEDNYERDNEGWTKDYVQSLITLGALYHTNKQINDAFIKVKMALDITEDLFYSNEKMWGKEYLMILRNLASLYEERKELKKAINLYKKSLVIVEKLFEQDNDTWVKDYIKNLRGLSHSYIEQNEDYEAIEQLEVAFKLINKKFHNYPKVWSADYIIILENLVSLYLKNYYIDEVLPLVDEVIHIKKILLKQSPSNWTQSYFNILYNLAIFYKENDKFDYAIYLGEEAYSLSKKFYNENLIEVQTHVKCLVNFASLYTTNSCINESKLLNEALEVIEKELKSNQTDWENDYVLVLNKLASSYENDLKFSKAIEFSEKVLNIMKKSEGKFTATNYKWQLEKLGTLYENSGKFDASINIFIELLQVIDRYDINNVVWFKSSLKTIDKLIQLYTFNDQIDNVIFFKQKALELIREAYNSDPTTWREYYKIRLHKLASVYRQNNQFKEALEQENKILNIK